MEANQNAPLKNIFISYRERDTAGETGRLADTLKQYFSADQIFMDIDKLEPGVDFTEVISSSLDACDVMLAVIGPDWEGVNPTTKQSRIKDANDWVALEISTALKRKIRVVPILVNGGKLPASADLPEELQPLLRRQSYEISNKRWSYDTQQLAGFLEKSIGIIPKAKEQAAPVNVVAPPPVTPPPSSASSDKKKWIMLVAAILVVASIGAYFLINDKEELEKEISRNTVTIDSLKDADADGVPDFRDKESMTPSTNLPVDKDGVGQKTDVEKDTDGDGVPDTRDRELNTARRCFPTDEFGVGQCPPENVKDSDGDGVPDDRDKEAGTKKECFPVDNDGIGKCAEQPNTGTVKPDIKLLPGTKVFFRDTDGDGVIDSKDKEPKTPKNCFPVDKDGVGKCPPLLIEKKRVSVLQKQ